MTDTATTVEPATPVLLTARAAARIAKILDKQPQSKALRIAVAGGGCSGFQYEYTMVADEPEAADLVLARDGARVYIDEMSLQFLDGSQIDFVDDLIGQSFQITNPNAVASCGCGTSFSV